MNRVLAHLGTKYPIIQAPMGWIARSQLASAVCEAGALGIIETSSGETEACKAEIEKMRELTDKPFGVNLPILFLKDRAMLDYVCASGVKFVTTSAGSPAKFIEPLHEAGIIVYHAVPTLEAAVKCAEAGVDGLVVEGAEGGGFKNPEEVSTLVLLQAIRREVDLPLVAAGGICDGKGMAAAFALGAEAVQMGTRFVSAAESPVQRLHQPARLPHRRPDRGRGDGRRCRCRHAGGRGLPDGAGAPGLLRADRAPQNAGAHSGSAEHRQAAAQLRPLRRTR